MSSQLSLNNVSIRHGQSAILDGVHVRLEQGMIGALVGPSGDGKTTLLRTIAGLHPLHSGEIRIGDVVVADGRKHDSPVTRGVSFVFQDFALFPHMSARKNVEFAITHLPPAERTFALKEAFELLELHGLEDTLPSQLSAGQKQRTAIARGLVATTPLLLMDEPFGNLDPELKSRMLPKLLAALKAQKRTVLFITHDQTEAFMYADYIGVIAKGGCQQWSPSYDVYHRPQSRLVAEFIGGSYFVRGEVRGGLLHTPLGEVMLAPSSRVADGYYDVLVRADDIVYDPTSKYGAPVCHRYFRGANILYELALASEERVTMLSNSHHNYAPGTQLPISLDLQHPILFPVT